VTTISDAGEVKAEVSIEFTDDGTEKAKEKLEGLDALARNIGSGAGASDALDAIAASAEDASKAIIPLGENLDALKEPLEAGKTIVSELTGELQDHTNAIEGAGEAYAQLNPAVEKAVPLLEATAAPIRQIAENAQTMAGQIESAGTGLTNVQEVLNDATPLLTQFSENAQEAAPAVRQLAQEATAAINPVAQLTENLSGNTVEGTLSYIPTATENIAAFQDIISKPQAFNALKSYLSDTNQTLGAFYSSIGDDNATVVGNMIAFQDAITGPDTFGNLKEYASSTGQTFADFASTLGNTNMDALHNVVAFQDTIANPKPFQALSQYLNDTGLNLEQFSQIIGPENAQRLQDALTADPAYMQAMQQAREATMASTGTGTFAPSESAAASLGSLVPPSASDILLQSALTSSQPVSALENSIGKTQEAWDNFATSVGSEKIDLLRNAVNPDQLSLLNSYLGEATKGAEELGSATGPKTFADNMAAFNEAIQSSDPMGVITDHLAATQQTFGDFANAIGGDNEQILNNVQAFQDAIKTTNPYQSLDEYQQATGQSTQDFASTLTSTQRQTLDNMDAFQAAMQDPAPYAAIQEHLANTGQTVEQFSQSIGESNARALDNMQAFQDLGSSTNPMGDLQTYFQQTGQDMNSFSDSIGKSWSDIQDQMGGGGIAQKVAAQYATIGGAAEEAGKSVKDSGGLFSDAFSSGGVFGDVGETLGGIGGSFGDLMNGFDQIMRPLMYLQMGAQMASGIGSWIYNANLAQEGGSAGSPSSYTSQASNLWDNMTKAGNQFAVGLGQGLLPSIEGANNAAAQNQGTDTWKQLGDVVGGVAGGIGDALQISAGIAAKFVGSAGGFFSGGNALTEAGSNWLNSGGEGMANTIAKILGQPLPYASTSYGGSMPWNPGSAPYLNADTNNQTAGGSNYLTNPLSPYYGMDSQTAQAAWNQSHYTGTTGPSDPANAYEHAIAMRAAGDSTYPVPAASADVAANELYFNSLGGGNTPMTTAIPTSRGIAYGGTVQASSITEPGGLSNLTDPGSWGGAFSDLGKGLNNLLGVTPTASQSQQDQASASNFGQMMGNLFQGNFGGAGQAFNNLFGLGGGQEQQGSVGSFAGGCFVAGTPILLATGNKKSIEALQIGQKVISHDGKEKVISTITDRILFPAKQVYKLSFSNGIMLTTTDSHPIATKDGWKALSPVSAKKENPDLITTPLQLGDFIYTVDNTTCTLVAITHLGIVQVYNITTDGPHTYYANGILVHNAKGAMTAAGTGTEPVSLSHTFRADVTWEANNLSKSFTAIASWAVQGAEKMISAIANWAVEGAEKMINAVANWAVQGAEKMINAVANWAVQGAEKMINAVANWIVQGAEKMINAVANWAIQGAQKTINAIAQWVVSGAMKTFDAIASWVGSGLVHLFTGIASWVGQNLVHVFVGVAQWIQQTVTSIIPAFASGVQGYTGWAMVGEAGPELVNLNGGSVYPMQNNAGTTPIAIGGGGGNAQAANITVMLDSQAIISAMGVPLSQAVRVGMGNRGF